MADRRIPPWAYRRWPATRMFIDVEHEHIASWTGDQLRCARCGLLEREWSEQGGEGLQIDDELFCCLGCAEQSGCSCSTGVERSAEEWDGILGLLAEEDSSIVFFNAADKGPLRGASSNPIRIGNNGTGRGPKRREPARDLSLTNISGGEPDAAAEETDDEELTQDREPAEPIAPAPTDHDAARSPARRPAQPRPRRVRVARAATRPKPRRKSRGIRRSHRNSARQTRAGHRSGR